LISPAFAAGLGPSVSRAFLGRVSRVGLQLAGGLSRRSLLSAPTRLAVAVHVQEDPVLRGVVSLGIMTAWLDRGKLIASSN